MDEAEDPRGPNEGGVLFIRVRTHRARQWMIDLLRRSPPLYCRLGRYEEFYEITEFEWWAILRGSRGISRTTLDRDLLDRLRDRQGPNPAVLPAPHP